VLIADDHPVVRQGLRQILAEAADVEVIAEAATGQEVLEHLDRRGCEVVLLDLSMPGRGGLEVLEQVKGRKPRPAVLVLTIYPEAQYATRALRAGAAGFLSKNSAPEELLQAVRTAARGHRYITPSLAERLAAELDPEAEKPPHERLSSREYQVLCLIASGRTVGEIAQALSLSVKTISTYRARLLEKMGLETNAELTGYALRHQLVE
jgi:DNA-binding NarL/FixJ family response regulator